MPSDDKNIVEFPSKNNGSDVKDKEKRTKDVKVKKPHKSIGWFIGVVILILISITFILPTTVFSSSSSSQLVFGKYNGKKISLEADNFFYYQLQTIANYYAQQYGGSVPQAAWMQIYYQAFQSSIIYEAISEMATEAKIAPSSSAITQAVINSGYWNDENGNFDTTRYQNATSYEKSSAQKMVELSLPYTMVMTDIQRAKLPTAESDFIASISDDTRSFDYLVVGPDQYGDAEAVTYANNNPEPFAQIGLSAITYATEAEATDSLSALNAGTTTFEDAVQNSIDGYKANNGSMGLVLKNTLNSLLSLSGVADASDIVFSTPVGSYSGPYYTSAGYTIFRVDSEPAMANLEDPTILSAVKNYIAVNDNAIISPYLKGVADSVYALAQEDIDKAISEYNLKYYTVDNVAQNPGNSGFVYSISGVDAAGYLASAVANNPEYLNTLYTTEYGTVIAPQASGTSFIIAIPQEATEVDSNSYQSTLKQMIPTMYESYASQLTLQDLQNSILLSDKVENNFFNVYASQIMSSQT